MEEGGRGERRGERGLGMRRGKKRDNRGNGKRRNLDGKRVWREGRKGGERGEGVEVEERGGKSRRRRGRLENGGEERLKKKGVSLFECFSNWKQGV